MGAVATPAPADLGAAIQAALSGGDTSTGTLQTGEAVVTQTEAEPNVQPQSEGGQGVVAPSETAPAQTEAGATEEVVDDFDMGLDPPAEDETAPAPEGEAKAEETQPEHAMSRSEADKITQAFMRTPSGRRMRTHDLAMQELSKPPEEGGLGITPTVDQIKEFHQAYLQHQRFIEDFNSGDPQNHASIAHFLFGAAQDGAPPPGAAEFIDALPDHLGRSNPALKNHLQTKLVAEVINTPNSPLYEQVDLSVAKRLADQFDYLAQNAVGEEDKVRWSDAAMLVRYARGISAQGDPQAAAQATNDPEKLAMQAELARIKQERQREVQTSQQRAIQVASGQFYGSIENAIKADVEKSLAIIKDKVGATTFEAHRTAQLAKLRDVAKRVLQNETVGADKKRAIGTFLQSRSPSAFDGVVRTIRRAYQDELLESRKNILADVGVKLKEKSAVTTAKLQQAQQHTEASPTNPSAGVGGAKVIPERLSTESVDQHLARVLATALKS